MSACVFNHPWLSGLFDAPQIAPLWEGDAQVEHLRRYELAWTRALQACGRISDSDAADATRALETWQPDWAGLKEGTSQDGVVVPALVRQMRNACAAPHAIHTGSTSQDVIDTALALTLNAVSERLKADLEALCEQIDGLVAAFGGREMMGRTRMQAALPIQVSHRLDGWQAGLKAALERRAQQNLPLQFGGAVGDGQALDADAQAVAQNMAEALGLVCPARTWHTERSAIVGYGAWLMQATGALGKIGQDIALMSQQGLGEITLSGGGGSSAMPHKTNPVNAELLVTLARYTAGQSGLLGQAMVHEQERSGAAWALEWMVLPPMTMAAGCATHKAHALLSEIASMGPHPV